MPQQICTIYDVKIEIINHTGDTTYEEELVEDILSVITVFSAKLYGSRSKKAKEINESLLKEK
ncbi:MULTISPECIES: hypothetical protein [unclassified Bacillus (in: firmicutes)]|uniref:hypothetical protein n=1 Tax=unclassified Bacillus (in: firmicutes) TaxID=185979 RepID=UPI000B280CF2|nr:MULTISPECIES: hypothetical protein [unclassified Bacillus (in: firmicutes)]